MADTIGQFMTPVRHSDEKAAPLQPAPELSIPAMIPPEPAPSLSIPAVIPLEPAPILSVPAVIPFEHAPVLSTPAIIPFTPTPKLSTTGTLEPELAPPLSVVHPPTSSGDAPYEGEFPDDHPGVQVGPKLGTTGSLPDMPAPPLPVPQIIPFEPPPQLSVTASVPFQNAPPLSIPQTIPFELAPILSVPAVIPLQDAPPLKIPNKIPFEDAEPIQQPHAPRFAEDLPFHGEFPDDHPGTQDVPQLDQIHHPRDKDDFAQVDPPPHPGAQETVFNPRVPAYWPDMPMFDFSPNASTAGNWHSSIVVAAEMQRMTLPGFAYETAQAAGDAIRSLHLNVGIGPWNVGIGGMGVITNFDPRQLAKTVRDASLSSVKAMAQGALNSIGQGLTNLINPFATLAPGSNPTPGTTTAITNVFVPTQDYVFTYAQDSRAWLQSLQQRQAADSDALSARAGFNMFNDNNTTTVRPWKNGVRSAQEISLIGAFDGNIQTVTGHSLHGYASTLKYAPLDNKLGADQQGLSFDVDKYESDLTVIPLAFTDMRQPYGETVRFQPFIKSLTENFAPQWSMQNYFGRTDPVATYQSTSRTINLSFHLICFDRKDLDIIFKKIAWLNAMVYPEYEGMSYARGPVIKMRIGDLINANGGGVTGVITSLNFSYDGTIWELDRNARLPRNIDVTLAFQVLHEKPVGVVKKNGYLTFGGVTIAQSSVRDSNGNWGPDVLDAKIADFRSAFGQNKEYIEQTFTDVPIEAQDLTGKAKITPVMELINKQAIQLSAEGATYYGSLPSQIAQKWAPREDEFANTDGVGRFEPKSTLPLLPPLP